MSTKTRLLSKSDFTLALTCEAKLFFRENGYPDTRDDDAYTRMLAQGGYMVEALAKEQHPNGVQLEYHPDPQRAFEETRAQLAKERVTLFQGTLLWNRRLARVDILEKDGNTLRLIEVKSKSFDGAEHAASLADGKKGCFRSSKKPHGVMAKWERTFEDVAYQTIILERLFPDLKVEPHVVLVDTSKRSGVDNVTSLFKIERHTDRHGTSTVHTVSFVGDRALLPKLDVLTQVHVAEEVNAVREAVDLAASQFERLLDAPLDSYTRPHGARCGKCEFHHPETVSLHGFRDCWGELADVEPHVLDLFSVGTVKSADRKTSVIEWLVRAGKASMFDIPEETLVKADGSVGPVAERQRRQISCARTGEIWVGPELGRRVSAVTYPLHFVDFEASRLALPYHAGMRPYGLVAFQWSCHTVAAPGAAPVHSEWLNAEHRWPNEEFARTLRAAIGNSGSVLTWSSFEGTTLETVAGDLPQFGVEDPELVAWLADVKARRIVDLHQWAQNHFHHPDTRGRTSIKPTLDAIWRCDDTMRAEFERWTGTRADPATDPYASLPGLEINGRLRDVHEGTGAITAYEAMMYGVEMDDEAAKAAWRKLLLQYCGLD
ncbi:MAG TPA: DUF2779 domain-containing protein, partial [Gemmatimonadaceae bacterium]|nr:DUF2779 domain-containing protein [Gemmatimonadaceae bacterium]